MKVIKIDKFFGYCPGLKHSLRMAFELAEEAERERKKVYYDVPLAHNEDVANSLKERGFIEIVPDEKSDGEGNYFLISAHGASDSKAEWLESKNFVVRSAICPTVKRVQELAKRDYSDGYQVVIFGKNDHAEIQGVAGCVDDQALIVDSVAQAKKIRLVGKASVICQTTFSSEDFQNFCDTLKKSNPDREIIIRNTVCPIVEGRIKSIRRYIEENKPDIAVVVGSKTSSNTRQLADELREILPTMMIGNADEIQHKNLKSVSSVIVVSGTSAPPEVVEAVASRIESL